MLRMIALAAVLLASPALAQDTKSESQTAPQPSGEATSPEQQAGEKKAGEKAKKPSGAKDEGLKGYGYGTPPGVETHGAKQATEPGREKSKAPQQEAGASVTQPGARAEAGTLSGRIVSREKGGLTIEAPDGLRQFRLTRRTKVSGEGRRTAAQLRPGDEVRVAFAPTKEGVSVAKRIEVRKTGDGKAAAAPAPGSATPPGSTTPPPGK